MIALVGAGAGQAAQASPNRRSSACARASDQGVSNIKHCAPYTVRVEALAGVAPVSGTLTVECRQGFVRGFTGFGALTPDTLAAVTRTVATPTSYTIDYTFVNTTSGGIYLQAECLPAL
jgi:hypothetical protein